MTYDSPWPVRKIPTHNTVHYTSYHMESKTHVVVTSNQKPITELPLGDNPEQAEKVERGMSCDCHMLWYTSVQLYLFEWKLNYFSCKSIFWVFNWLLIELARRGVKHCYDLCSELSPLFLDDRFVYPMDDIFQLQLYSPLTWEPIPTTKWVSSSMCSKWCY